MIHTIKTADLSCIIDTRTNPAHKYIPLTSTNCLNTAMSDFYLGDDDVWQFDNIDTLDNDIDTLDNDMGYLYNSANECNTLIPEDFRDLEFVKPYVPTWNKSLQCWEDDEYLDYSKIKHALYSQGYESYDKMYRKFVNDYIIINFPIGVKEFDDYVYHWYRYYYNNHSFDCVYKSKYDLRDSCYDSSIKFACDKNVKIPVKCFDTCPGERFRSSYVCYGMLLTDAVNLSKIYGKSFIMDLLIDATKIDNNDFEKYIESEVNKIVK